MGECPSQASLGRPYLKHQQQPRISAFRGRELTEETKTWCEEKLEELFMNISNWKAVL